MKASEQDREDIARQRVEWRKFQEIADSNRLIFLDETCLKTNMTRIYGRSRGGRRCFDSAPGTWETQTLISSLRLNGATESILFDGPINREMFDAYITKRLIPTLMSGDIVIMDNLNTHKSAVAQKSIENCNAKVLFLPPYSPDLNPIEKMWSKIKQIIRGIKPREEPDILDATRKALDNVTAQDAAGWFKSCTYNVAFAS